jgi:hypothetical protein
MHSGGSQKLEWGHIFIEAEEEEAGIIFYNRFGKDPDSVTCSCCGADYSVREYDSLEEATEFHRGKKKTLEQAIQDGYFTDPRWDSFVVIAKVDICM